MEEEKCKILQVQGADEEEKKLVIILVGPPGSGKSTFCENVIQLSPRQWSRICQDTVNKGKSGTKAQCLKGAISALNEGKSVFIDRCNLDKGQRHDFVKLGGPLADVHAVVLDLPAQLCISRSVKRAGHEGNLQGGKAAAVVNRMLQKKELPNLNEGFARIRVCRKESDVEAAIDEYSKLGRFQTLPNGYFAETKTNGKNEAGIMKYFKKTEGQDIENVPTLGFPSISTGSFQFDCDKASEIIVEKVEEYMDRLGNAKLVLVDVNQDSKILSLVKTKAEERNIDSKKFFTLVGDITCLSSSRNVRCNVLANAANWRLKPGGGGVNAAIFNSAGSVFESATKERGSTLSPGHALIVPLPCASPLHAKEGVSHIIHVLGPNMNPQRPNYLDNDYSNGCQLLREAYSSLFDAFLSIVGEPKGKHKRIHHDDGESETKSTKRNWGSWAQSLFQIAMDPEKHRTHVLEFSDKFVVLNDLYPKAKKHILVLARHEGLDSLADVGSEHLELLSAMHEAGLKWARKFIAENPSLAFRLGYHSVPSMRQLHLHVVSQDFDSSHLKNKKHWNSFNTVFFRDSNDVMGEVEKHGRATINGGSSYMSQELRCHRCGATNPNIPNLKSHLLACKAAFPSGVLTV